MARGCAAGATTFRAATPLDMRQLSAFGVDDMVDKISVHVELLPRPSASASASASTTATSGCRPLFPGEQQERMRTYNKDNGDGNEAVFLWHAACKTMRELAKCGTNRTSYPLSVLRYIRAFFSFYANKLGGSHGET